MSATTLRRPAREAAAPPGSRRRLPGLVRGSETDARWVRPVLLALLAFTTIAYVWDLSASGDANSFYAAAVQAGTRSWKAFFFGSLDVSNFITVDKPPAALWVMELSGRIFGFSSLSMLIPDVLEGVVSVALLYAMVKRWFGAPAGLLAGATLALTPVAALMFRFNNPDALLVCLLVAGAYCMVRALEGASTRWILAAGAMVGFAFLAKMMQAFLVLPAFALVYAVAAPTGLRRRLTQILAAGGAVVVSAGWWVTIVALWPAGSRPMIDGSPDNNIFNLILGYNGLGRIFGSQGNGGGAGGISFSGSTGPLRLFNNLMGAQASWLLPAALISLLAGFWITRRAPRTDRRRAALLLWGGWLFVTAVVFSFSSGVIHTYYTIALAPAIAAPVAIGAAMLWGERRSEAARAVLACTVAATTAWSWVLLDRTPGWESWLRWLVVAAGALAVAGILAGLRGARLRTRAAVGLATLTAVACLGGPLAYAAQTVSTAHTGGVPSAGPSSGSAFGGGFPGAGGSSSAASLLGKLGGGGSRGRSGGSLSGASGFGGASTVSQPLRKALEADGAHYRWVAATSGSSSAASYELATGGDPVMAIGGFSGEGGHITLTQFKADVARGEIRYYIAGSGFGGGGATGLGGGALLRKFEAAAAADGEHGFPGGGSSGFSGGFPGGSSGTSSTITAWVKAHYRSETIGGETVYDLTQPK